MKNCLFCPIIASTYIRKFELKITHPNPGEHDGDVIEVWEEESSDSGSVADILHHCLDPASPVLLHKLARVRHFPRHVSNVGGSVLGPQPLHGVLCLFLGSL